MCLTSIDSNTWNHTEGYKIYKQLDDGSLINSIRSTDIVYQVGKSYNAKSVFGRELETFKCCIEELHKQYTEYKLGFHYYLSLKDAKAVCSSQEVIVKIKVRNILASGKDGEYRCGVAEDIYIEKLVYSIKENRSKEKSKMVEDIISYGCIPDLISAARKKDHLAVKTIVTQSDENFACYILFGDLLNRSCQLFKSLTRCHICNLNNQEYKEFYNKVVSHKLDHIMNEGDFFNTTKRFKDLYYLLGMS